MADTIEVVCPQCQKQIKAPAEMQGKKVRCKGCGATFAVQAAASKSGAKSASHDEDEDSNPYRLGEETESTARCPFCAKEMESPEAVLCLHCGYNTRTRQRLQTRTVYETTTADRIMWLLPGIICAALVVVILVADLLYLAWTPDPKSGTAWLAHGGVKTWGIIISGFIAFFAGKFAFLRLIRNPTPPEKEK